MQGAASSTVEAKETELGVSGAIQGYVVHPAVGDFGVDLDLLFRKNSGSRSLDTGRIGYGVHVNMLPRSATSFRLYARRRTYDYSGLDAGVPLFALRVPDMTTRWGGSAAVRRGVARGLTLDFSHLTSEYEDDTGQVNERQVLGWARDLGPVQSRLRLTRVARDLGWLGSSFEDLTVGLDQSGYLAAKWQWNLSGTGLRRDIGTPGQESIRLVHTRVSTAISHEMRRYDLLTIRAGFGMVRPGQQLDTNDYRASVMYRWRPHPNWSVTPFVDYTARSQDNHKIRSPRLNLTLTWNPRVGTLDAFLSSTGSYGKVKSDNDVESSDTTQTGFALVGSLAHGARSGLRKAFEAEVSHNQLRLSTRPILDLPDLGLARNALQAQDYARARFGLDRTLRGRSFSGWIQWTLRQSSGDDEFREFESESYSATLGYSARRFNLRGHLGQTEVQNEGAELQTQRFAGAQVRWNPLRYLDLRASYRTDSRRVSLAPNLSGAQYEAGATLHVGLVDVAVSLLRLDNELDDANDTSRRTVLWSVSRRFAGWLPVVTGTRRAGVIR